MPRFPICLAGLAALSLACQSQSPPAATPWPSPSAAATPQPALRPPADAVLADADIALPRTAGRDHLSAAEAARDTANEVLALEAYSAWGWVEASTRTWSGGGRQAAETLLLTLRAEGAGKAFDAWAADAARAPYAATDCTPAVAGLDQCRVGLAGDRALVVGRRGAEVFRIETMGLDAPSLAAKQAARLIGSG
jgi:hypothetical protein